MDILPVLQLSDSLNCESRRDSYTCWKCWQKEGLLYSSSLKHTLDGTDLKSSDPSIDRTSSGNDADSNLTDTSQLAQVLEPLSEFNYWEVSHVSECTVASYVLLAPSNGMTLLTAPHSSQGVSAGERRVVVFVGWNYRYQP
jgi:hypothetical protein